MISDLRDLSRQRESLVDEMTSLKIEIKQLLNLTFPEHYKILFSTIFRSQFVVGDPK